MNESRLSEDLDQTWEVLAEPIQTVRPFFLSSIWFLVVLTMVCFHGGVVLVCPRNLCASSDAFKLSKVSFGCLFCDFALPLMLR